jgi:hypothetical protein
MAGPSACVRCFGDGSDVGKSVGCTVNIFSPAAKLVRLSFNSGMAVGGSEDSQILFQPCIGSHYPESGS